MFAVRNIWKTKGCSDGSLHSRIGMRVIFFPVAVSVDNRFTVSVYPRVERQCAHSILWLCYAAGQAPVLFFILVSICVTKPKTSRPPLSSATVRRPVAATSPHPLLVNTPLITFPRIIRAPQSCLQPSPSTCCAAILMPGSPSEASVCTPAASASCPHPAATACSIPVSLISTGSSTPWALPASMGCTMRPCRSGAVTCRAYMSASSASAPGVRPGTVSDIPVQSCPGGLPLQRIDCNFVFICFIWLVGAPSSPTRQLSDPVAPTMRWVAVRVFLTNYQPGLIN